MNSINKQFIKKLKTKVFIKTNFLKIKSTPWNLLYSNIISPYKFEISSIIKKIMGNIKKRDIQKVDIKKLR